VHGSAACLSLDVTTTGIVSNGVLVPATLTIGTSVTNAGTIENGAGDLSVEIGGDLTNDAAWTNRETIFTGPADHRVNAGIASIFESALTLDDAATGDVIVESPFALLGNVDTGNGRMILDGTSPLTLREGAFEGELSCNGNEVRFESWSYLTHATLDAAVLVGEVEVSHLVSFTGGLTVMDVLQNLRSTGNASTSIAGGLINHGEIRNDHYGFTVNLSGDLVCDGVISCSQLVFDGQSDHHLSMGPAGDLDTFVFLPEFGTGTIVVDTDAQISGALTLGLGGTLILSPGTTLHFADQGSLGTGTVLAGGSAISMDGTGALGSLVIDEAVLQGVVQLGGECSFTGGLVVEGTLQGSQFLSPDAQVAGLLVNEGLIRDGNMPLTIRALGDVANQGDWENARLVVEGTDPQAIEIGAGIDVPEIVFESHLIAVSYQWYRDGQPIEGETSATLTFATLGAGDTGTYHCEGDGQPSRTITITAGATGIAGPALAPPGSAALLGPGRPNPLQRATTIDFELREATPVQLAVYDVTGRQVSLLVDGRLGVGRHDVSWRPRDVSPGVYFLRLKAGTTNLVRKVTLVE
jgi:hypothetical protein